MSYGSSETTTRSMARQTWQEVGAVLRRRPNLVLLPVGALEQHGHHLPLGTDSIMVESLCLRAAEAFDRVLVAPGIPYGTSANHEAFPGTVSVRLRTLVDLIVDIGTDLFRQGASIVLIVNGHGGNTQAVAAAAHELRQTTGQVVAQLMWTGMIHESWAVLDGDISWHADESETSLMLALAPQLVHVDRAVDERPKDLPFFRFTEEALLATKVDLGLPKTDALSSSGTIGSATLATRFKGEAMVEEATANLRRTIAGLLEHHEVLRTSLGRSAR
ncbi:MAG TPA: creatininase family protein [Trueperaceae bacterium]